MKQLTKISMLVAFGFYRSVSAQTDVGLEKTYELANASLTVNEPVVVKSTVTNHLPTAVAAYRASDLRLTRPDGTPANVRPPGCLDCLVPNPVPLVPFETRSTILLLNKSYSFDVPGRYILKITNYDETPGPPSSQVIGHQTLTIDIGPRDPARLNQVCDQLETAIAVGLWTVEGDHAAEALAYIDDPVAVPYIARVLATDSRKFRGRLFPALGRIGDAAAAETLILYLSSHDEEERALAKSDLSFILGTTTDPSIKARIKGFLSDR